MFIKILLVVAICQFIEYDWNILNYNVLEGKRQIRTEGTMQNRWTYHTGNIGHKPQSTKQEQKHKTEGLNKVFAKDMQFLFLLDDYFIFFNYY